MKDFRKKLHVSSIALMSSPGCNLQCKYCHIADESEKIKEKNLYTNTVEAIKNGIFLQNVLTSLRRLEVPISNIDHMELWGQEPTLSMPILGDHIKEWLDSLYSVDSLFFSTNGMNDSDIIYDFILKYDEAAHKNMTMSIQLSYDGEYGENYVRGGDSQYLKENFVKLFHKLNNINFKNIVHIEFMIHSVCSTELIYHFDTYDKVEKYIAEMDEFNSALQNANLHRNIEIITPSFAYQNGYNASTEDGIRLNTFCKHLAMIQASEKYPNILNNVDKGKNIIISMGGFAVDDIVQRMKEMNANNIEEYAYSYLIDQENHPDRKYVLDGCSSSISELKFLYDGTLIICQNSIFDVDLNINDIDSKDNMMLSRYHLTHHNNAVNLITASETELEKYFTGIIASREPENFLMLYSNIFNMMLLLSKTGQIDDSYYNNLHKIQKHALLMTKFCWCYYNVLVLNGSKYVRNFGEIRQMANGVLDRLEQTVMRVYEIERNN